MTAATAEEVRAFILERISDQLDAIGMGVEEVPDDFDLLFEGAIDSLGLLQLVADIEERFDMELDFERLDMGDLAVIGPFSRYIADLATSGGQDAPASRS